MGAPFERAAKARAEISNLHMAKQYVTGRDCKVNKIGPFYKSQVAGHGFSAAVGTYEGPISHNRTCGNRKYRSCS